MTSGPAVPAAISDIAARVDTRLAQLLDSEVARWTAVDAELAVPLESLRAGVLQGGKRLRPACCYWSFVGAGGRGDATEVLDAACALELLHAAALLHDDVIDGSARRHGAETRHVEFARRHRDGGWGGNPEAFGAGVAILLGDLAQAYARRGLLGAPGPAVALFDEVAVEVNVGQYLDLLGSAVGVRDAGAVERARQICRYKTAKYTVERPLHLGAALAAPQRIDVLTGPLSAVGLPLGEAFQLKDDLLGVFGDPDITGKPVGDDLRQGKPTLLAALARAGATGAGARLFDSRFGAADLTDAEATDLVDVIEATGARAQVEATIAALAGEARRALDRLAAVPGGWADEATAALREVADFVTGRAH